MFGYIEERPVVLIIRLNAHRMTGEKTSVHWIIANVMRETAFHLIACAYHLRINPKGTKKNEINRNWLRLSHEPELKDGMFKKIYKQQITRYYMNVCVCDRCPVHQRLSVLVCSSLTERARNNSGKIAVESERQHPYSYKTRHWN